MTDRSEVRRSLPAMYNRLWRFALRLTRNPADADDLTQEVCCKALACEEQYRDKTYLWGWLSTMMYNAFVNELQRNEVATRWEKSCLKLSGPFTSTQFPELVLSSDEALSWLTECERRSFVRVRIFGEKQRDIATELELSNAVVCANAKRGAKKMAAMLEYA